jgi:hypothetical protein
MASNTFTSPSAQDEILAAHITQLVNALTGAAQYGFTIHVNDSTDAKIKLPDAAGAREFQVLDSGGVVVFDVDSDGNISITGTIVIDKDRYVRLKITDTDGTVNGQLWMDDSEDVLKFLDSSGAVKTISTGLTHEGGNTTEATSTSTSAADLVTASSLTLAVGEPFELTALARKTAGASSAMGLGLTVNSTVVREATTAAANALFFASAGNRIEGGLFFLHGYPGQTNYQFGNGAGIMVNEGTAATGVNGGQVKPINATADFPLAAITTFVIRGITASASQTMGVDEAHVYSRAVS